MRKHPLIALTAFTALGASAVAGASTGALSSNSVLTSARAHRAVVSLVSHHTQNVVLNALSTDPVSTGVIRSLIAVHDRDRPATTKIDSETGLPEVWQIKKTPRKVRLAAVVVTTTTQPAPVAPPTTAPPAPPAPSSGDAGGVWYELRMCESGDNYSENTGNGYYGAYQFSLSTWYGLGFTGLPSDASPATQDKAAEELQAEDGWGQWPACSAELGL